MTLIRTRIRSIWDNKLFRMSWAYREWREIVAMLERGPSERQAPKAD